jgi:UDP-N-acetyl-D-mannosaminuronic acid dehydrogenase
VENDRVIGGMTGRCSKAAIELYKIFVRGECVITNSRTAEMAKLTENASRDVSIAFANELSIVCDQLNIDVWELIKLANRHPRVNILKPGPGVGGHCIAVDPWFIISKTPEATKLMHAARQINDTKPLWVIEKVKSAVTDFLSSNLSKTIGDVTVACFGLTFKPDIDDLRESPALKITQKLAELNSFEVLGVEPNIVQLSPEIKKTIKLVDFTQALKDADICVFLVDHAVFSSIHESDLDNKIIVDAVGKW